MNLPLFQGISPAMVGKKVREMSKFKFLRLLLTLALVVSMFGMVATAAAQHISGAIFTTDLSRDTNVNLYTNKTAVFLNGGPLHEGAAGLPDGSYYVMVTDPSGKTILGSSLYSPDPSYQKPITVTNGEFAFLYQLSSVVYQENGAAGYATTPNAGGEYKVWVSADANFAKSLTKTDNFKEFDAFIPS